MAHLFSWRFLSVLPFCGLVLSSGVVRASDEMWSGCAGGITGGSAGVTLSPDGRLWNWQRSRAGSDIMQGPLIGTDADAAMRLFEHAKLGGFSSIRYRESGNRTCWVELSENGQTHGVYWSDRSAAPALAIGLFDEMLELHRALMSTSSKAP